VPHPTGPTTLEPGAPPKTGCWMPDAGPACGPTLQLTPDVEDAARPVDDDDCEVFGVIVYD
jgi:hypothetical protein